MRHSTPLGRAVASLALLFAACSARPMTALDGTGGAAGTGGGDAGGMGDTGAAPADPPDAAPADTAPPDTVPPDAAPPDAVPPPPDAESPSAQFKMIYETTLKPT